MSVASLLLLCVPCAAPPVAQEWGDVKGQVLFAGKTVPDNPVIDVRTDRDYCLAGGPIRKDELIVDKKTKGVRYVMVWLAPVKDFRKPKPGDLPIKPSLKTIRKEVTMRIDHCRYDTRMLAIRQGTALVVKGDKVHDNVRIEGLPGVMHNVLVAAEKQHKFDKLTVCRVPLSVRSSIHPWMKAWVGVFHHPYFAITDEQGRFEITGAPAGRWRLVLWQEAVGYFPFRNKNDVGVIVEIKPGKTTDVGKVKFVEPKD
jgi:hypothetical protein